MISFVFGLICIIAGFVNYILALEDEGPDYDDKIYRNPILGAILMGAGILSFSIGYHGMIFG